MKERNRHNFEKGMIIEMKVTNHFKQYDSTASQAAERNAAYTQLYFTLNDTQKHKPSRISAGRATETPKPV